MDTGKPTKTLADYMVIAISPVLIMVMVHSVCFFLVDVFYRGEAGGGVRWVLFWFVLAVVLITRIGIEQGDTQAVVYGVLLAGAAWCYLAVVQQSVVFGALLLGIVWFTAHRLTINCTLVDDDVDASGQGLLQSLRRLPGWLRKSVQTPAAAPTPSRPSNNPVPKLNPTIHVRRVSPPPPVKPPRKSSTQVPGVWLIYYSLAALPIFGLGQTLLPAADLAARQRGFVYLFCYLAAALGLLITTSFLGLRRYLRQRYVAMPARIALGWIQFGVIGAAIVMLLCLLLPRPGAGEAWVTLRYHIDHQLRQASEYAARFNPHGQGKGRAGEQAGYQPSSPPSTSSQTPSPEEKDSTGGTQPGGQSAGQAPGSSGSPGGEKNAPPQLPSAPPLYGLFKSLFYLGALVVIGWLAYRYRAMLAALLRDIWTALQNFIASVLALFRKPVATAPAIPGKVALKPFKTFQSPFLTGANRTWPPEQLIAYTYEALQSWALEKDAPAVPQTPREFCRQLGEELPDAAAALEHLAFLYGHVAYGASVPANLNQDHLRSIWDYLALPRRKVSPPVPADVE